MATLNKYQYVDTKGTLKTVDAASPELAISSAPDRATTSGVQLISSSIGSNSVQQTDTAYRTKTNENVAKFQNLTSQQGAGQTGGAVDANGNIIGPNGQVIGKAKPEDMPGYKPPTSDKPVEKPVLSPDEEKTAALKSDADARIKEVNTTLDSILGMSTQATANLISSIKQIYGARIDKMVESNRRSLRTKTTVGLRQGRARYAPGVQAGILTDEEIAGHERIATLEGAMLQAVAAAEQAQADNNMKVFNSRMDEVDRIEKELQTKIMDQHKMAVDQYNAGLAREREDRLQQKEDLDRMLDLSARSAPAVYATLSNFKTPSEKQAFLEAYSKKTGIDMEVLFGDIEAHSFKAEKQDLDLANIRSQIAKRDQPTSTDQKSNQENDIAEAILRFQDQIKSKGWKGINPDEYEFYREYLRNTYGASAVLELDKAIEEAELEVDVK